MSKRPRPNLEVQPVQIYRPTEPQGVLGGPNLQEIMECPVCYEICVPPIYICVSGHTLCQFCKKKVGKSCPCCRKPVQNGRNYALESIYNGTLFSCNYKDNGCRELPRGDQFESHVKLCPFRPFICEFYKSPECNSKIGGSLLEFNNIVSHLFHIHSTPIATSGQYCFHSESIPLASPFFPSLKSKFGIDVPLTCWEFDGRYFLERLLTINMDVFIALVIIGEKSEADNYIADHQLIRQGIDCSPNILKNIQRIKIQSIREPFEPSNPSFSSQDCLRYTMPYFIYHFCRPSDPSTQGIHVIKWISRVDIKKL